MTVTVIGLFKFLLKLNYKRDERNDSGKSMVRWWIWGYERYGSTKERARERE